MARRLSFRIAQPIVISGFWMASILLLILVGLASNDFKAPGVQNQALTQAYYYAIYAAALYQLISYLLCVTVWGAYKGHYAQEFKLTMSQRTLMLQTVSFMAYLLVGAAIYAHLEDWGYLDAVYWADFTCLTVGIGDFAPATKTGRGLLFPYAIGGIVALGLVVGSIRSLVLDRGKKKLFARMTEKTRESILKQIGASSAGSVKSKIHGLDSPTLATLRLDPADPGITEHQRRKAEFDAMRAVQDLAAKKRKWISLGISGAVFLLLWFVGALIFYRTEEQQNWNYFDGLYFAYTSLLTIGYGDLSPTSNSGKPFFVFWSLLAVPSLTILISDMGDTVVKIIKDLTIYLGEITVLPSDQGGLGDRLKYGLSILTGGKLGKTTNSNGRDIKTKVPGMVNMIERDRDSESSSQDLEVGTAAAQTSARSNGTQQYGDKDEKGAKEAALAEDEHHYRYLLIKEIKQMYHHLHAQPPKTFSYQEWEYYLRLLGEDEYDSTYHRRPPVEPPKDEKNTFRPTPMGSVPSDHPQIGPISSVRPQSQQQSPPSSNTPQTSHGLQGWSWLGNKSPLMGEKSEAAWILEQLFAVLERALHAEHKRSYRHRTQKEPSNEGHHSRHGSRS